MTNNNQKVIDAHELNSRYSKAEALEAAKSYKERYDKDGEGLDWGAIVKAKTLNGATPKPRDYRDAGARIQSIGMHVRRMILGYDFDLAQAVRRIENTTGTHHQFTDEELKGQVNDARAKVEEWCAIEAACLRAYKELYALYVTACREWAIIPLPATYTTATETTDDKRRANLGGR